MGILFISHSSRDNEAAIKVRTWLKENGWGEVFLDLDPEQGLAAGQRWQQELKQAGERCSGVLVLISPDWLVSRWCQTEFLLADQLGKKIFPLFVAPTSFDELPLEMKAKFQLVDISEPSKEAEGYARLAIGLKRSGLDPKSFAWPPPNDPHRPIYRGLESLDEEDAAVFFGRDALITKGLDAMRRMRDGAPERVLVILGASGAGKSSFLKAGLIARLKRDEENFLVLPVIRPERAALTGNQGLAASLGLDPALLNEPRNIADRFAEMRVVAMDRLRRFADAAPAATLAKPLTVIIPIDQAEEFFTAENTEAAGVIDLLAGTLQIDRNTIIVATIRSDSFAKLQGRQRLAEIPLQPFNLPPIPLGAFKEVIEGPARLANPPLSVEPALSDRLLHDLAAGDALPLLAFTLERLSSRRRGGGTLTLAEYADKMGGLQGAIRGAVDAAFAAARRDPALPDSLAELEKLARAAFIPALVHLDDADAEPRRRVERLSALPEPTHPLVRHLIDQRLLVSNRSAIDGLDTDTVEVTHEAILRQWPSLRAWIAEERDALRTLDSVREAAAEWHVHKGLANARLGQGWLVHRGARLEEAETLLTRSGFTSAFGTTALEYLAACRAYENAELLRERMGIARTRRLQRNIGILVAVGALVVLLAGAAIVQLLAGISARVSDTLATQAAKEADAGNYDRSARYALAGITGADWLTLGDRSKDAEAVLRGDNRTSSALAVLRGHKNFVYSAAFSPDGTRIVSASRDRTARIWDARTGLGIAILRGHSAAVTSAAFSPDGTRIVTASEDMTARIWDARTGTPLAVLTGHQGQVESAVFSPDGKRIATASDDGTARVWDAGGTQLAVLRGHEDNVNSIAYSRDGARVVTASDDKTARVWEVSTWKCVEILRGHESGVASAEFSPDGRRIVTASGDRTARIWDANSGQEILELRGHEDALTGVSYKGDGSLIVTSSNDRTARLWDAKSGREIATLSGHDEGLNSAAFSPDGMRIATASNDRTARVWDAGLANHVFILRGHEDVVTSVAYSPDGRRIASASNDKTARVWDANSGGEILVLRGHGNLVESVAFNRDGTRIATASDDNTARIWDAESGRQLAILRGHSGKVNDAVFSPDGARIVTASTDATARIWDPATGRVVLILRGHVKGLNTASFSPDGRQIVTSSGDGTARIWNARTGRTRTVLSAHRGGVSSAIFSADGTRIVTTGRDDTAIVWNASDGREIVTLRGHDNAVLGAVFSRDGSRIITGSWDRTARLWDANTGQEIAILHGHGGAVESVAFSPDGMHVATASDDTTARIWNASAIAFTARAELVRRTCEGTLAHGLSEFSRNELYAAPVLDPRLNVDACHPPSLWARVGRLFRAGISR